MPVSRRQLPTRRTGTNVWVPGLIASQYYYDAPRRTPIIVLSYYPSEFHPIGSDGTHTVQPLQIALFRNRPLERNTRLPYYAEFVDQNTAARKNIPLTRDEYGVPFEHLILHLDRDVEWNVDPDYSNCIVQVSNSGSNGPFYLPFGRRITTSGRQVAGLRVTIRRHQFEGTIPLNEFDRFGRENRVDREWAFHPPLEAGSLLVVRHPRLTVVHNGQVSLIEHNNEIIVNFEHVQTTINNLPQTRVQDRISQGVVSGGVLRLGYWNANLPGAMTVRLRKIGRTRLLVEAAVSRNIKVDLQFNPHIARIADLKIAYETDRHRVPRPGHAGRWPQSDFTIENGAIPSVNPSWMTVQRDATAQRRRLDMLSTTAIGFLPVVGDLYDVADLVSALLRGRDLQGEPVDEFTLLMIGLACLPVIPRFARTLRVGGRDLTEAVARTRASLTEAGIDQDAIDLVLRPRSSATFQAIARADSVLGAIASTEFILSHINSGIQLLNFVTFGGMRTALLEEFAERGRDR